jgi:hypothetical protein
MDLLFILHNVSLIQTSVFKCICRQARDRVALECPSDRNKLRLCSYDLFCYFNISPGVFYDKRLRRKLEDDIIASDDTGFLHHISDLGWKYNFETMNRAVMRGISLKMMMALRDRGCHWGSGTLMEIIRLCVVRDSREPHRLLQFALADGYPLTSDNVATAIMIGDAFTVREVVNAFLESAQTISINVLTMLFVSRMHCDEVDHNENIKANAQDIINFYNELKAFGICNEP